MTISRLQNWIIGLTCAILFVVGYFFAIAPLNQQRHQLQERQRYLQSRLAEASSRQLLLEENIMRSSDLEQRLFNWEDRLIRPENFPDLLKQIRRTGVANQLSFSVLEPGAEKIGKYYSVVPVNLLVTGSYDKVAKFIAELATMPWLVVVQDFTVLRWRESVSAEIVVEIYHLS